MEHGRASVTPTVLRLVARGWAAGLLAVGAADAQVSLLLTRVPAKTPAGAPIYVAGTFNNWNRRRAKSHRAGRRALCHYAPDPVRDRVNGSRSGRGAWSRTAPAGTFNRSLTVPATGAAYTAGRGWRTAPAAAETHDHDIGLDPEPDFPYRSSGEHGAALSPA
jgi:hypothetical protein